MNDFDEIEIINEFDEDDEREGNYKASIYPRYDNEMDRHIPSKSSLSNERSNRYLVIYDEDDSSSEKDDEDNGRLYLQDSDKSRVYKGDKSNVLDDDYYHQEVKKLEHANSSKLVNKKPSKINDDVDVDDIIAGVQGIGIGRHPKSHNKEDEEEDDNFVEVKNKDRYEENSDNNTRRARSGSRELQVAKKFKELEEHVQKLGSPISNLGNNIAKMSEYVDELELSSNTKTRRKSSSHGRKDIYDDVDGFDSKDPWLYSEKKHSITSKARRSGERAIERSFIGEYEPNGRRKLANDEELLEYRQLSDIPLVSARYAKKSDVRSEIQLLKKAMDESDEILKQYGRTSKVKVERPKHYHQEEEEEKDDYNIINDDDKISVSSHSKLSLLKRSEPTGHSRRRNNGSSSEYDSKIDREVAKISLENIRLHEKHLQEQIVETKRKAESFLKALVFILIFTLIS